MISIRVAPYLQWVDNKGLGCGSWQSTGLPCTRCWVEHHKTAPELSLRGICTTWYINITLYVFTSLPSKTGILAIFFILFLSDWNRGTHSRSSISAQSSSTVCVWRERWEMTSYQRSGCSVPGCDLSIW